MATPEQIEGVAYEVIPPYDTGEWWTGRVSLPIPGGDDVPLVIFTYLEAAATDGRREALRRALALTPAVRGSVEAMLYEDYVQIRDLLDPGAMPEIAAPADVWAHARPIGLGIPEHGDVRHRHFSVEFRIDWEGHGTEILFRDGVPIERAPFGSTTAPQTLDANGGAV